MPVLASALMKALRAELLLAWSAAAVVRRASDCGDRVGRGERGTRIGAAAVDGSVVVAAVTFPAGAFVVAVPAGVAPDVAT